MVDRRHSLKARVIAYWVACSLGFGIVSALFADRGSVGSFVLDAVAVAATWGLPVTLVVLAVTGRWDRARRERAGVPPRERWAPSPFGRRSSSQRGRRPPSPERSTVGRIPKASLKRADRGTGVIEASVGMTWHSWGERVKVRVREVDGNQSQVEVVSEPRLATTIADYGKNQSNVDAFIDAMT